MTEPGHEPDISIRTCRYADLDQVQAIERESFPDPYHAIDFVGFLIQARKGFIVACLDGSVAGYVIGINKRKEGFIQSMAVAAKLRRKGVGESLMGSVIEHLSTKHRRISLFVDKSNEAAIHLYRKFRFSETGRVKKAYYRNGNDAIEMTREARSD